MNDGGPAFPQPQYDDLNYSEAWDRGMGGMSVRDVFVAAIAAGDWASQSEEIGEYTAAVSDEVLESRAKVYGRMANAMLKEREEKNNESS